MATRGRFLRATARTICSTGRPERGSVYNSLILGYDKSQERGVCFEVMEDTLEGHNGPVWGVNQKSEISHLFDHRLR